MRKLHLTNLASYASSIEDLFFFQWEYWSVRWGKIIDVLHPVVLQKSSVDRVYNKLTVLFSVDIIIVIIIITSRYRHGYPWRSLTIDLYCLFLLAGLSLTSRIGTEQPYVGSSWSSYLCSSMWRGPPEYNPNELVLTSPAVSCMSNLLNFDSFRDGW